MEITSAGSTLVFSDATPEELKRILNAAKEPTPERLAMLSRKGVADRASVSTETIKRWGKIGKLHPVTLSPRCVRYDPAEVEALLRNGACGEATV